MKHVFRFKRRVYARDAFKNLNDQAPGTYSLHKTRLKVKADKDVIKRLIEFFSSKGVLCDT